MSSDSEKTSSEESSRGFELPELNKPLIEIWAPELRRKKGYWQVGTSPVSRVKINELSPEVEICTEGATTIPGTSADNWEPVKTLGTAVIRMRNEFPIRVHVTRSRHVGPLGADGILGLDNLERGCWKMDRNTGSLSHLSGPETASISAAPGTRCIPNYESTLTDRYHEKSIAEENGEWSIVSGRLLKLRSYFPRHVIDDDRSSVVDVLEDYADCFYLQGDQLRPSKLFKYSIKSRGYDPVDVPQNQHSTNVWKQIEIIIQDLLRQDIIRPSTSAHNSPIFLHETKDHSQRIRRRIFVDYKELNKRSAVEPFPIPDVIEIVDELEGSNYFSVLNSAWPNYQIELEAKDRGKTAFTTISGRYEYQRMPIGLKNAPEHVQRLMNKILTGLREKVFVCQGSILVHTATMEEHEIVLRRVFARFREAGLKFLPDECQLFRRSVKYLSHVITHEGLLPEPRNIRRLENQQIPSNFEELEQFLQSLDTFERFIPDYMSRAKPLYDMLMRTTFQWTVEARVAFDLFKLYLSSSDLLLRYPNWNQTFIVETGTSQYGVHATLMQQSNDFQTKPPVLAPIAYSSALYTPAESKCSMEEKERLASVYGMNVFRRYLQNNRSLDEIARTFAIAL